MDPSQGGEGDDVEDATVGSLGEIDEGRLYPHEEEAKTETICAVFGSNMMLKMKPIP
eukprot:CAMPEP_0206435628 /NCGR_PEP_ID=MMETSP0324_2-20121206/9990_1 /ASSEMBLY_ACC=CAM_ASM_000836 /TAXON_ID=2866 /ORGANISM="Crypthecodinium cohnii, Strain Seligo" /LENGTH=56 /DNA_ID=CAMNT_0053902617 /DNA_START=660 /DNA_END=830 /DNA_ORIENTATION=-